MPGWGTTPIPDGACAGDGARMRPGRHREPARSPASAADGPIVCGIDDTASSAAVRFSATLALRARRALTIVHASGPQSAPSGPIHRPPDRVALSHDDVPRIGRRPEPEPVEGEAGVVETGTLVLDGDPADSIVAVAREQDASLVIVGSRGGGPVHPAVPGGVSRDVIRRTDRPVLVVGDHHRLADDPWRVIAGVDRDNRPDRVTRDAVALAQTLGSTLTLVHVASSAPTTAVLARTAEACAVDPPSRSEEVGWLAPLAEEARASGVDVQTVVREGDVVRELLRAAGEADPCFVVVGGSRRRGAVASAALGSVSSALLASGACPILLASPPR